MKTAEAEKYLSDNGYGKGTNFTVSTVAYLMEAYAAQQSKIKLPNPSIDEIEKMAVDNFSSTVYADIISWTIRWMHKEAQQSKMPTRKECDKKMFEILSQPTSLGKDLRGVRSPAMMMAEYSEWLRNQIEK